MVSTTAGAAGVTCEGVDGRDVAGEGTAWALDTRGGSAAAAATRDGVTGAVSGGGTAFDAPVCALGGAGAGAAGNVVAGRDAPLDVEAGKGAFEPGSDVTAGLIGGGVRCAIERGGTTVPGTDGASRKMTSERPTNPSATAATPYTINVFTEDPALPPGERG